MLPVHTHTHKYIHEYIVKSTICGFFLLILLELQQAQNEQLKQQDRQKLTQFLAPTRRRTQEMFGVADTFLPNPDDDDTQSVGGVLGRLFLSDVLLSLGRPPRSIGK